MSAAPEETWRAIAAAHEAAHLVVSAALAPARGVAMVFNDAGNGRLVAVFLPAPTAHLPRWPAGTPKTRERMLSELAPLTAVECAAVLVAPRVWQQMDPFSDYAGVPPDVNLYRGDDADLDALALSTAEHLAGEYLAAGILRANHAAVDAVAARLAGGRSVWVNELEEYGIKLIAPIGAKP